MSFTLKNRLVGGDRAFIIANIALNHDGNYTRCLKLMDEAAAHSADAFTIRFSLTEPGNLTIEGIEVVAMHCEERGYAWIGSPDSIEAADVLDAFGAPAFKVASRYLTRFDLIKHLSTLEKRVFLSTGGRSSGLYDDVERSLQHVHPAKTVLLQCTSVFPCPEDALNLGVISAWRFAAQDPWHDPDEDFCVGLSDHVMGYRNLHCAMAYAAGARVFERHYGFQCVAGIRRGFEMEMGDLAAMRNMLDRAQLIVGASEKTVLPIELPFIERTDESNAEVS